MKNTTGGESAEEKRVDWPQREKKKDESGMLRDRDEDEKK